METKDVANKLVELCRQGKNMQALEELYAENIVSLEPAGTPMPKVEGINAVRNKSEQWYNMVEEVHSSNVSQPVISENHFSVNMEMDITMKGQGRQKINEIAVYEVDNGKIVQEQFFYRTN